MKRLVYFLCVALSFTSISFFKIGMAEFTLFHALVLVVLFFMGVIALKKKNFNIAKPALFFTAVIYLCAVNLVYLNTIKLSSFIFSLIILLEILLLYNCVKKLSTADIKKIVKTIIIFYFINIVIATVFIKLKIYPTGITGQIFKIYIFDHRIRPYGFSDEPSYASLILIFSLFVLFKCDNFSYKDSEFKWYIIAIAAILLTGSSYGYMLLAILLAYFILKSRVFFMQSYKILKSKVLTRAELLITLAIVVASLIFLLNKTDLSNNKSVQRLVSLYNSITSSNDEAAGTIKHIAYVDGSASMRLVPTVLLIDDFKKSDARYMLFGRGAGQSVPFFSKLYEGNTTILGFMPSFLYNYGIAGGLLFLLFFLALFPKHKFMPVILFIFFIFNADFNTQIFLFVLFSIMASKQIEHNSKAALNVAPHAEN